MYGCKWGNRLMVIVVQKHEHKTCKQCLLYGGTKVHNEIFLVNQKDIKNSGISNYEEIFINEEGLCRFCVDYNSRFNKKSLERELNAFVTMRPSSKNYDAIVAYSGGKNSTLTLYYASQKLGMKVLAYMLDNGFIPDAVKERSKKICDQFNIELEIVSDDIYKEFLDSYKYDSKQKKWYSNDAKDLCLGCSSKLTTHLHKKVSDLKINKVIYGLNTYMKTYPRVSCIAKKISTYDFQQKFWVMALPFAIQINYKEERKILESIGWYDIDLNGYTSNCMIPGFTQGFCKQKYGISFDLPYLSKELRCGYLTKDELLRIKDDNPEINHTEISKYLYEKKVII